MDPVNLITTAVAAGASAGLAGVAKDAVKDIYQVLRSRILAKYGEQGEVSTALTQVENKPDSKPRQEVLEEELKETGAGQDQELIQAAQQLLAKADPEGTKQGAYTITQMAGNHSIQIGQARDVNIDRKK